MSPRARLASKRARSVSIDAAASGRLARALRQREPQQQRIDPGLVADERDRVGGTLLVEEPIAVRAQQIQVARVGFERRAEVSFGGGVAAAMRDFAQQRLGPGPSGAVDAQACRRACRASVA